MLYITGGLRITNRPALDLPHPYIPSGSESIRAFLEKPVEIAKKRDSIPEKTIAALAPDLHRVSMEHLAVLGD
jgi:hypothetical protein